MDNIQLTVIGCGDAFSSGGMRQTCFYVKSETVGLLIDCGASAIPGLKQQGIDVADISYILISHFHGDHYGGLPYLLLEAAVMGIQHPITIMSPPGCKERVASLLELLYPGSDVIGKLDLRFIAYQSSQAINTPHFELFPVPVSHTPASHPHGLRVTMDGTVISYSGDTEWTPRLEDLAASANLFICECNFYHSNVQGHLDYLTLMAKLPQLSFKRLLLTHFDEEMLQHLELVKLDCAFDGMKIWI